MEQKRKYIAYKGQQFTIEWYFDGKNKSSALEYFLELSNSQKDKVLYLFRVMGDLGKIVNEEKFRYEGDQIYEFKPSPDRFLCFFFVGGKIVVTNAFEKKTAKLPIKEKERALKYKADYIVRAKKGVYYE
jgi:phage-related protein